MAQQGQDLDDRCRSPNSDVASIGDAGAGLSHAATLPSAMPEQQEASCDDAISLSGDLECPICYQMFCDPVLAGCDRHVFCRNCLLRAQRGAALMRCPICRCESRIDVSGLPVVADILEKVEAKDPQYSERSATANRERAEYLKGLASRAAQTRPRPITQSGNYFDGWHALRGIPQREVCDAGSAEVNGIYVAGVLPSYVGPPLYRKLNSSLFIFRWRRTRWVIAEVQSSRSMGDEREWLYHALAQPPDELPPIQGWEAPPRSRASGPAPEVRVHDSSIVEFTDLEATVLPENEPPRTATESSARYRRVPSVKCCSLM